MFIDNKFVILPYIDQGIKGNAHRFHRLVKKNTGDNISKMSPHELIKKLGNKKFANRLSQIYKDANSNIPHGKNINVTSMSILSKSVFDFYPYLTFRVNVGQVNAIFIKPLEGWGHLSTGDAILTAKRADNILDHYKTHLKDVFIFVLPHHGSDHNINEKVARTIPANIWIASSDNYGGWKHPGPLVQKMAVEYQKILWRVSRHATSRLDSFW